MYTEYFYIGGGNKTCLVWDTESDKRDLVAKALLQNAEQVGFVSDDTVPTLTMMGGELCVNGILGLASRMDLPNGHIQASGINNKITYERNLQKIAVTFELPHKVIDDIVLFEGIGFLCCTEITLKSKADFQALAQKYAIPAFGVIEYVGNKITPWIYVAETDSLIQESACGSGSIAIHLITGSEDILQPTGNHISIQHTGNTFTVIAEVERIN